MANAAIFEASAAIAIRSAGTDCLLLDAGGSQRIPARVRIREVWEPYHEQSESIELRYRVTVLAADIAAEDFSGAIVGEGRHEGLYRRMKHESGSDLYNSFTCSRAVLTVAAYLLEGSQSAVYLTEDGGRLLLE